MSDIEKVFEELCQHPPVRLPRRSPGEQHFVVEDGEDLVNLCRWAREQGYYLCTLIASDERLLEDNAFKLYYVLSAPEEDFLVLEHPLRAAEHPTQYLSIRNVFPAVEPLEREMYDHFGLSPFDQSTENPDGFALHTPYPVDLYPLRRTRPIANLMERLEKMSGKQPAADPRLPEGVLILPVGPIHAGVIEPGHFAFHVAGEVVEELSIRLGYKHKGIEKLFETEYLLEDGWRLAELVSGDSSFAHSLAYCQAVEALAGLEPPDKAIHLRGLFLELERLYNHIADVGALAHDMAFDLVASPMAALREALVQLNQRMTGHRYLRGVNRPGGILLIDWPDLADAEATLSDVVERFLGLSKLVLEMPACRDRAITTGILTQQEAWRLGATGLAARASGWIDHDCRLRHPQGIYAWKSIRQQIEATITPDDEEAVDRRVPVFVSDLQGDVFARMALRVAEVETSTRIVQELIQELQKAGSEERTYLPIDDKLRAVLNYEFGLGYTEGWRGDIFYWVMKGPNQTIFRCKVRDPSLFNWPALSQAVVRKTKEKDEINYWENILADFPLINKSFNLSYSGHDL